MKKIIVSQEEILKVSRKIILEKGIKSLSMRQVASECNVALGSIYNYFPSKADLISTAIESIWAEIFEPFNNAEDFDSYTDCVESMFSVILAGNLKYPGFFNIHSLNFSSEAMPKGKKTMEKYFSHLSEKLFAALEKDAYVRSNAFSGALTQETFIEYTFTLLIAILLKQEKNCDSLIAMIKMCIY